MKNFLKKLYTIWFDCLKSFSNSENGEPSLFTQRLRDFFSASMELNGIYYNSTMAPTLFEPWFKGHCFMPVIQKFTANIFCFLIYSRFIVYIKNKNENIFFGKRIWTTTAFVEEKQKLLIAWEINGTYNYDINIIAWNIPFNRLNYIQSYIRYLNTHSHGISKILGNASYSKSPLWRRQSKRFLPNSYHNHNL